MGEGWRNMAQERGAVESISDPKLPSPTVRAFNNRPRFRVQALWVERCGQPFVYPTFRFSQPDTVLWTCPIRHAWDAVHGLADPGMKDRIVTLQDSRPWWTGASVSPLDLIDGAARLSVTAARHLDNRGARWGGRPL